MALGKSFGHSGSVVQAINDGHALAPVGAAQSPSLLSGLTRPSWQVAGVDYRVGWNANATITIATPAVVTESNHGHVAGEKVTFYSTGALPTGITAGTSYFVISAGLTTNAYQISTTSGGAAVNTSGSQSGFHIAMKDASNQTTIDRYFGSGKVTYSTNSVLVPGLTLLYWNCSPTSGGITIDAWDFTQAGGVALTALRTGTTIQNCMIALCGNTFTFSTAAFDTDNGCQGLTIKYNEILGLDASHTLTHQSQSILFQRGTGPVVFQYNYCHDCPSQVMSMVTQGSGTTSTLDYRFNYNRDLALNYFQHMNMLQLEGNNINYTILLSFNTCYQSLSGGSGGEVFQNYISGDFLFVPPANNGGLLQVTMADAAKYTTNDLNHFTMQGAFTIVSVDDATHLTINCPVSGTPSTTFNWFYGQFDIDIGQPHIIIGGANNGGNLKLTIDSTAGYSASQIKNARLGGFFQVTKSGNNLTLQGSSYSANFNGGFDIVCGRAVLATSEIGNNTILSTSQIRSDAAARQGNHAYAIGDRVAGSSVPGARWPCYVCSQAGTTGASPASGWGTADENVDFADSGVSPSVLFRGSAHSVSYFFHLSNDATYITLASPGPFTCHDNYIDVTASLTQGNPIAYRFGSQSSAGTFFPPPGQVAWSVTGNVNMINGQPINSL